MDTTNVNNYADAPESFGKCLMENCTAAGQCLRYLAARAVMKREKSLRVISPAFARPADGENCPFYRSAGPVRMARGFKRALGTIPSSSLKAALWELRSQYSKTVYYRMRNGETPLNAREQELIAKILTRYGAPQPIAFDSYEEIIPW